MLKRILKPLVWLYVVTFVLAFICFPRTVFGGIRNANPQTLLAPLMLPVAARSYWQFVAAGVWPFSKDPHVASLGTLVDQHGQEAFWGERLIKFDMAPQIRPGHEGKASFSLGMETYSTIFLGGYADVSPPGAVIQVGQYICLSDPVNYVASWTVAGVRCGRLFHRNGNNYEWKDLGQSTGHNAVLLHSRP